MSSIPTLNENLSEEVLRQSLMGRFSNLFLASTGHSIQSPVMKWSFIVAMSMLKVESDESFIVLEASSAQHNTWD